MFIPFALGAAGLGRAILGAQEKDPNRELQQEMWKQSGQLNRDAMIDVGGAEAAQIRNAIANQLQSGQAGAFATGRGYTPATQSSLAGIASRGAGAEMEARRYGRERSDSLRQQSSALRQGIAQQAGAFKSAKRSNVIDSLIGGGLSGLGAYAYGRK